MEENLRQRLGRAIVEAVEGLGFNPLIVIVIVLWVMAQVFEAYAGKITRIQLIFDTRAFE